VLRPPQLAGAEATVHLFPSGVRTTTPCRGALNSRDFRGNAFVFFPTHTVTKICNDCLLLFVIVSMTDEHIVLVDENNNVLGTMPKPLAHNADTPLHRGFSLFLFNPKNELLLQQRSSKKKTWPGVWSNSCCGHPMLNESNVDAAHRRLKFELGMTASGIKEVAPYRYKFAYNGVVENEICPILVGYTQEEPNPNPEEVGAVRWVTWPAFLKEIKINPKSYSEWCVEEASILVKLSLAP